MCLGPSRCPTTIAAEQDAWGSIAQLAAELRRAEANHYDVETLLPRLVRARGFTDAEEIAAASLPPRPRHRTPAGSARIRKTPRLIAGLIPEATGTMRPELRHALTERRDLIETRADTLLDAALTERQSWVTALGASPTQTRAALTWRQAARPVAAYRDRYGITDTIPLGPRPEGDGQKIDAARACSARPRSEPCRCRGAGARARTPHWGSATEPDVVARRATSA